MSRGKGDFKKYLQNVYPRDVLLKAPLKRASLGYSGLK